MTSRIIAIANQKGGVGKTTTTVNLATALAACGQKVLLIDLDPQGNASTGFGIDASMREKNIYDVLFDLTPVSETIQNTKVKGLDVIPSSVDLSGAEIQLIDTPNREQRLKEGLAKLSNQYDYIFIDCPPSLGLLTLNALIAAQSVLVPLQCEFYALEGLSQLKNTIDRVQNSFNPTLDLYGIVLTMYDKRNNLSAQVEQDVRGFFGDIVFETIIPRNVKVSEAPSHGLPAIVYDMTCAGSEAYLKLAKEIIEREQNNQSTQNKEKVA